MPGLPVIAPEVNVSLDNVNVLIDVLDTCCAYAPSNTSIVPAAAYPVSEYVISGLSLSVTSLTEKL